MSDYDSAIGVIRGDAYNTATGLNGPGSQSADGTASHDANGVSDYLGVDL